ncbi:MAG: NAD(P)/FAD-dependent oxidoreductase, partial [Cellvibrio sp.]|nr:NAD(P)/FAD-dependent oxidoreductase [Cellvibrio sp.]
DFMANLAGLESNRINQLHVNEFLQTTRDATIFAIGDCAQFTNPDGTRVPPRAQSAHQMASACYKNITALLNNKPLTAYKYTDYGSVFIEGRLARMVYISLYRMHQIAIHGLIKTGLVMLGGRLNKWLRPRLKLH